MNLKLILKLTFAALIVTSCSSNSPDDLEGDIPANVTYNEHVRPIIQSNCIACHSDPPISGAPMPLTDYDKVKQAVLNTGSSNLIDRISRAQGASGMMPNGGTRLPQTSIDIIVKWQAQNFQN